MSFFNTLTAARALLQQQGRVSARALKREFALDDETFADLRAELVDVQRVASEDAGGVLVWTGGTPVPQPPAAPRALAPAAAAMAAAPDAERRFLTVLFADLVDATPLSERLDPEQLGEVYRAWQDQCIEVISVFGGHVAEYRGDGAYIHFGWPVAQEDAAQRAIRTGLGIVERLATLNERLHQRHGVRLQVRIGIHSGLVLLSNLGGHYVREQFAVGETPNLAARLQALAQPGQVLVSDTVHAIARADFHFDALGDHTLKGLSRPVRVWQALSARKTSLRAAEAQRAHPRLIGRDSELALLRDRWALAMEGHGRVVLVSGEAGIGKSRLVAEHRVHAESLGARRIVLRGSPYHGATPLYPVAELMQRLLKLERQPAPARVHSGAEPGSKTPDERLADRLSTRLAEAGLDATLFAPLIAPLVGLGADNADSFGVAGAAVPPTPMAAREERTRLIQALVQWLLAAARQRPLLLVCEDLHWADATTLEMIGQFIDQVADERVLALFTARPEFTPPWQQRSHVSHVALARLSDADALAFAADALQGRRLERRALERIVARADGVPLFIEELVHTVADRAGAAGAGALADDGIPDTLQGSLMARLDREAEVREIAQIGAAAGREFSLALMAAVAPCSHDELQHGLARLVDSELLQRRGSGAEAVYRFRHALIRDAAYESTLKSRRATYHRQIAAALERLYPALAQAQPELLARHLAEAGEPARAVELWRVAGERALNRCATEEALAHQRHALALLPQLPATPARARLGLRLEVARGAALMMSRGQSAPEVEEAYGRARDLTTEAGDSAEVFPALMGLWRFYGARGRMREALAVAERLHAVAQASGHGASLLGARMALGMSLFHLAQLAPARALVLAGVHQYRDEPPDDREIEMFSLGQHPGAACAMCLSFIDWLNGDAKASRAWSDQALAIAERLDSPFQITSALGWRALLHYHRGEDEEFRQVAQAALERAEQGRFPLWMSVMRVYRGLLVARGGAVADGLALIHDGLAMVDEVRLSLMRPRCLVALAQACLLAERCDDALQALQQAEAELAAGAENWWLPELQRLRGDALALRAAPGDAAAAMLAWREARNSAVRLALPHFEQCAAESIAHFTRLGLAV